MFKPVVTIAALSALSFSGAALAHGEGVAAHIHPHGFEYVAAAAIVVIAGFAIVRARRAVAERRRTRNDR